MKKLASKVALWAVAVAATSLWPSPVRAQTKLDPNWRVGAVDTTKPGFIWNYFSSPPNRGNSTDRAEGDIAGQATDSSGNPLLNVGDPNTVGAAVGPAAPASPTNGVLRFEIAGVINLSKTEGDSKGNFTPDELEPGLNAGESTDGQAAEILTYLTLPAGTITMGVNSDDGFQTSTGPNPQSAFGKVVIGEYNGGRGASDSVFEFIVQEAGTYAFRTIWENGGGDSNIEWFTVKADGTKVLINDRANGGIPAYRALASSTAVAPFVKTVIPPAVPRQVEKTGRGVKLVLTDGTTKIDDASVALELDGKAATVTKTRQGSTLTVDTGVLEGLHLAAEQHKAKLTYKDTAGAAQTFQWTFYNLENLVLPDKPVTGENFDSYPEATSEANTVPPGWVATNFTYKETDGWDLADITSDAYLNWVLITTNTVNGVEDEVLDNDKTQTINGKPVQWMSGNLLFVASDGRADRDDDGNVVGQIQFVVSKPFDLSAVANPVLTFKSGARLSGNATEMMAMEYSVDGGTNWLPVIYMQNAVTLKYRSDASYDAVAIFNTPNTNNIPQWPTPSVGPKGGRFADGILAPVTQDLAPYIANRNDTAAARRVEAIRLPAASKQKDVRLRLAHIGACGWEWGIDDIAFYDIAPTGGGSGEQPNITSVSAAGGSITIQWTGGGALEAAPSLTNPVWTSTGNTSGTFSEPIAASGNKFYRVKQ